MIGQHSQTESTGVIYRLYSVGLYADFDRTPTGYTVSHDASSGMLKFAL